MQQEDQNKPASFLSKVENFWYYYKAPVIIVIVIAAVLAILFTSNSDSVATDLNIAIVTSETLTEESINFNESLPGLIADANGDGEANITISRFFISKDLTQENDETYQNNLESQLANKGAIIYIADAANYERLIKKDAFCPLDEFFDTEAYGNRVMYRGDQPIAFHLTGSKLLADMSFTTDDLYAMLLFRRPEDADDPIENTEYANAVAVLKELLVQG